MTKMLDEVIHYCTRCKLDLNHRVVAVEEGVAKRVLCLTCKSERSFKKAPKSPATLAKRRVAGAAAATRKQKESLENEWKSKLSDQGVTPKPYSMESAFAVNDHIYHPTFGRGLVTAMVPPDKVHIYFDDGLKLLKCAKAS